jgi:hypothetical protein
MQIGVRSKNSGLSGCGCNQSAFLPPIHSLGEFTPVLGITQPYQEDKPTWVNSFWQWLGIVEVPKLPVNPSMPSNRPPIAPQTPVAMVNWTPEQQQEATAQANNQYLTDAIAIHNSSTSGAVRPENTISEADAPQPDSSSMPWWLIAGATVAVVILIRRN